MARDGTNRGGRRVRAGTKPEPLADRLADGRTDRILATDEMPEPYDFTSTDTDKGCAQFVSKGLLEAYAQSFVRFIQCEKAISDFGLLGKHPTTGAAIASPFVAMSQSFQKQANVLWYEIFDIVKANCTQTAPTRKQRRKVSSAGKQGIPLLGPYGRSLTQRTPVVFVNTFFALDANMHWVQNCFP